MNSQHVVDSQGVVSGVGDALASTLILSIDEVGADSLNLIEDVLLPCKPDGGHQDQGCRANYHAERGQGEPHLVADKRVVGKTEDLTQREVVTSVVCRGSIHLRVRCYGEFAEAASPR